MENAAPFSTPPGLEVRTYFVRGRNALLARADFGEMYVDYYLHQGQHGYQHAPEHDGMLKQALAALTLHCASRPWNETCGVDDAFPPAAAESLRRRGQPPRPVVGQLFTENVKDDGRSSLSRTVVRERGEPRRSCGRVH